MRVFALSDVHVDYEENARWLESLSKSDYTDDVLILAGDMSDRQEKLARAFACVAERFRHVFFVPGNHDLWVTRRGGKSSLEKFYQVQALAKSFEIKTRAESIGNKMFLPLLSWYDFSFGQPSDFIQKAWMDFSRCVWPAELNDVQSITDFFHQKNMEDVAAVSQWKNDRADTVAQVISFSHFLPRIDVMPAAIPHHKRNIYPVLGSQSLDGQLRSADADVHIYGHSHVNRCVKIDGVHYINNAYAYPSEAHLSRKYLADVFALIAQHSDV